MILGITLWAAITGTITSFLIIGEERTEGTGVPDQIRGYGDLMRDGLLTAEEFEAKKAQLLALGLGVSIPNGRTARPGNPWGTGPRHMSGRLRGGSIPEPSTPSPDAAW